MANPHSTGGACPAKALSHDDLYTLDPVAPCSIGEPERPPYGSPVSEAAKRLAKNVRLLRVSHGWSQEPLAQMAGLDWTFGGAVERAERNITPATAEKLAKAFNLSVAELLATDISIR